jgi:pimeloyl-ACP methyl ester carboxylesterase
MTKGNLRKVKRKMLDWTSNIKQFQLNGSVFSFHGGYLTGGQYFFSKNGIHYNFDPIKTQNIMKTLRIIFAILCIGSFTVLAQSEDQLISAEVVGKGRPILLIHGMSCSAAVWDEFVERYQDQYELHLISIQGFGNKSKLVREHYLKSIKDEVIAYSQTNSLQSPIILGHSMGGFIGLWAAAEEPELFSKIISVDGVPYFPVLQMPGISPETAKPMVESMKAQFSSQNMEGFKANQEMIVASMIATPEKREKVVEMGIASNPEVTGQAYGEMFLTDIRDEMEKIKAPVLVFGSWAAYKNFGATKESVTNGYQAQIKDIPNAQLLVAEEAYHFVFYDEPGWFYSEIEQFINIQ